MHLKSKENTAQGVFLGKCSFRSTTTGSLYTWEKIEHFCLGIPSDPNVRTMYLVKIGKSKLKNIVREFENLLCSFIVAKCKALIREEDSCISCPIPYNLGNLYPSLC